MAFFPIRSDSQCTVIEKMFGRSCDIVHCILLDGCHTPIIFRGHYCSSVCVMFYSRSDSNRNSLLNLRCRPKGIMHWF